MEVDRACQRHTFEIAKNEDRPSARAYRVLGAPASRQRRSEQYGRIWCIRSADEIDYGHNKPTMRRGRPRTVDFVLVGCYGDIP